MGCDAYADENGEFELVVSSYDNPYDLRKQYLIVGSGFEPRERLQIDITKGEER